MARILSLPFHCDQKVWCMPPSTGDWYDWYQSPTFGTVFFDSIMQFYFALIHFWIHFFFELKFDIEGFVFVWISHVCRICRRFIYPSMVWIIKSDYSQGFILIPIRTQLLFGTVLRGPFASLPFDRMAIRSDGPTFWIQIESSPKLRSRTEALSLSMP